MHSIGAYLNSCAGALLFVWKQLANMADRGFIYVRTDLIALC